VFFIRLHGVTELRFGDEDPDKPAHFNFFPDHMLTEMIMGLILMILLSVLATALPATMGERANPLQTPEVIKPEWFFYVTFRWLKLFGPVFAVLSMGFIVFIMFVWPWIDAQFQKIPGCRELSVHIGIVAVCLIIGLTVWEAAVAH
jgi:quinol-cytochrome oxidoreductase complex cytochrome b subunit